MFSPRSRVKALAEYPLQLEHSVSIHLPLFFWPYYLFFNKVYYYQSKRIPFNIIPVIQKRQDNKMQTQCGWKIFFSLHSKQFQLNVLGQN